MDWKFVLFSFEGRINRAKYWAAQLAMLPVYIGALVLDGGEPSGFFGIAMLLLLYPHLATNVKRCHDRDHSGWFILVSLIPIVSLWYAVEIGFMQGTVGANAYGQDPLNPEGSRIVPDSLPSAAYLPPFAELAGRDVRTTDDQVSLHALCSLESANLRRLPQGTIIRLGAVSEVDGHYWIEAASSTGEAGFVLGPNIRSHSAVTEARRA
jgi:uncharacterized membrane protein YhaH (DUF805 family)